MSSHDELASWLERHSETVRRISRDPLDAERKLALAERNLERAQRLLASGDPDFALVAAESAMVNAADAVLSNHGFRLRGSRRHAKAATSRCTTTLGVSPIALRPRSSKPRGS